MDYRTHCELDRFADAWLLYSPEDGMTRDVHRELSLDQIHNTQFPPLIDDRLSFIPFSHGGRLYRGAFFSRSRRVELELAALVQHLKVVRVCEWAVVKFGRIHMYSRVSANLWVRYKLSMIFDPFTGVTWPSPLPSVCLFTFLTSRRWLGYVVT